MLDRGSNGEQGESLISDAVAEEWREATTQRSNGSYRVGGGRMDLCSKKEMCGFSPYSL